MKVIIPAAGRSTRVAEYTGGKNKCLIEYENETLIFRLVRQIIQAGCTDITVVLGWQKELVTEALSLVNGIKFVENPKYNDDKNILSLLLGYPKDDDDLLIVESDVIISDNCVRHLSALGDSQEVVWTANGIFQPNQIGAILFADGNNQVTEVKYVLEYRHEYKDSFKNLGILFISGKYAKLYRNLLHKYAEKSWQYYFIDPLIDNLHLFPSKMIDFSYTQAGSFNTKDDLMALLERIDICPKKEIGTESIKLIPVGNLRHIEDYNSERVEWLAKKIIEEDIWNMPLCVEPSSGAVMDGQHRMEAAKALGLKYVPAVLFTYSEVDVWTLRPGKYKVNAEEIISRVVSGNIYPYKTAKHEFPFKIPNCKIRLDYLR